MHKRIKQGLIHSLTLENQIYRTLFPPKVDFFFFCIFMDKNSRPKRGESEGPSKHISLSGFEHDTAKC